MPSCNVGALSPEVILLPFKLLFSKNKSCEGKAMTAPSPELINCQKFSKEDQGPMSPISNHDKSTLVQIQYRQVQLQCDNVYTFSLYLQPLISFQISSMTSEPEFEWQECPIQSWMGRMGPVGEGEPNKQEEIKEGSK